MIIETFITTVKHDNGTVRFKVVSLSGKQGAVQQIMAVEGCPECAIVDIVKTGNHKI